jgi:DNA-binding transcriptional LysR family regulator
VAGPSLTPAFSSLLLDLFPASQRAQQKKRGLLAVECDLSGMLKDVLRNSHAISLMPAFMVAAEVAAGQLVCVPGVELGLRVRFGCAWLKARTLSPVTTRFMERCWPRMTAAWRHILPLHPERRVAGNDSP